MNPIFSKNPERALVVARALGAVQGPTDDEGKRLQAFLDLSRPPTADVLEVYRTGTPAVVIGVRVAVRYRVGPVCLALYIDVIRTKPGGISAVGEKDVQRLYTFIHKAALYIPPHGHNVRRYHECRCRLLYTVARAFPILDWVGERGRPDDGLPARSYGWYGAFTYAAVKHAVKQHCPRLVKSARRLAREVAWRTAKEKEVQK